MAWKIIYSETLSIWLDQIDKQQLKSIAKELRLLELCGCQLKLPHSKALGGGLFELRERIFGLRLYYIFTARREILLLRAGNKKHKNETFVSHKKCWQTF